MSENRLVLSCLRQAVGDPARALVRLWLHLREQSNLEKGLAGRRAASQVHEARRALEADHAVMPVVPAVAALQAIDEYLAEGVDLLLDVRPRRVDLAKPDGGGAYIVVPRRKGWTSRLASGQPGHLEFWMRRHQILPASHRGISVGVQPLAQRLFEHLSPPSVGFAAGGFADGVQPDWSEASPLWCSCLRDAEQRWASVESFLRAASVRQARILVLPELTIDPPARARLRAWLRENQRWHGFALVVVGSFHEIARLPRDGSVRHNVAYVLDEWGSEVIRHVKVRPMRATPGGLAVEEDLQGGSRVTLMRAPFGLVGVAICLDFCEAGDAPVTDLWRAVGPALMLVPSMGATTTNSAHHAKAKALALQHGTVVLVASEHPERPEALGLLFDADGGTDEGRPVLYGAVGWTTD